MGLLDWFFGTSSSNVEEPSGSVDWLGNPKGGAASRGGKGNNEWWGPVEQQNRHDEESMWW